MIKAEEARANINFYRAEEYRKVQEKVIPVIETISESIVFHSKNGFDHLDFTPYSRSHFPSNRELMIASEIFDRILKENGYKITLNNWNDNILKIQW